MSRLIELHRHLDASFRLSTLLELAQERGLVPQSTSLEAFRDEFVMSQPVGDLNRVLAEFTLFQKVLDRPEVLERLGYEAVQDCVNEGHDGVELRFSPSFVSEYSRLSWDDILNSFDTGVRRAVRANPEIRVGLICIASREYGRDGVGQTIEFFLRNSDRFIGLDLAGNEVDYPCRGFEDLFKPVRERLTRTTIHAGEASGPENMWAAIESLGAQRIGHGVNCVRDPRLMEYLARNRICLEICPTSNWITGAVPSLKEHPLQSILRAGVPACINTDDPTIFGVTLPHELDVARTELGLSSEDIEKCNMSAAAASFLP